MKNVKKIIAILTLALLSTTSNMQGMGHWNKIPFAIKHLGLVSLACYAITCAKFEWDKKRGIPFSLTTEERKKIEDRYNKHRSCTELNIIEKNIKGAGAATFNHGSKSNLFLPSDFFSSNSDYDQDAIIAHEATHFSQGHNLQKALLATATSVGTHTLLSNKFPKIALLTHILLTNVSGLVTYKICAAQAEKEADLLEKTPEELLNLLGIAASQNSPQMIIRILDAKKSPYGYEPREKTLFEKLTIPHAPAEERIEYFANQFEKQVNSPSFNDFPRSEEECKKALNTYFYHYDTDYLTGKPDIDHPLIHKRVAFLRKQLTWLQNNEA